MTSLWARQGGLVVLHQGRFGDAVAARVAGEGDRSYELLPSLAVLEDVVSGAHFVALAVWRRYPAATDALDSICARRRIPWSSVTLEGRSLLAGPIVVPGRGPCHACYRKRWLTHLSHPERELVLNAAYDTDPTVGCDGFPAAAVSVAAAALQLDRVEATLSPGRLRRLDLLNCSFEETRVVRIHGCERCGRPVASGRRYVDHLRAALAEGSV
jgi:bacteriocin biosynthesis cyclodehydratase domain-containing protein